MGDDKIKRKRCPKCKRKKELKLFNKNAYRKDGVQAYCSECQKDVDKFHQKNRDLTKKYVAVHARRMRIRKQIFEYLKLHPCIDCGENDVIVLEFDHRERKSKIMSVATMMVRGVCSKRIFEEINKCDVRCANCHRRKTAKQFGWHKDLLIGNVL